MYKISVMVAKSLNASFSMKPPPDNQWGSITSKCKKSRGCIVLRYNNCLDGVKVWDGMMGLVHQDKVDAAVGTIFYVKVSSE